jgi:catalase
MSDQHARPPITTTDAGAPASSDEHALTVGPGGPVLLQDAYLNEKLAHFVRRSSVFPERHRRSAAGPAPSSSS